MNKHEPESLAFCQQVRAVWLATGKGMRECGREIGISHGTLSRIANGHPPDLDGYFKVKRWMAKQGNSLAQLKELVEQAILNLPVKERAE